MKIYLRGGPSDFPDSLRTDWVDVMPEKYTVVFGNGREHFLVTDEFLEHNDGQAQVYEWSYRTTIAE